MAERFVTTASYSLNGSYSETHLATIKYTVNGGAETAATINASTNTWSIAGESADGIYEYVVTIREKSQIVWRIVWFARIPPIFVQTIRVQFPIAISVLVIPSHQRWRE